ncbi:hypothetical protein K7W03_06085 [Sphingobium sp. PNB]|uniref:hypothetical protein n=1 Tax=Sphingobium sp. PNB TaxID=863934 RepID=UPI001CA3FF5F|nr:hypothetical protein [Sphingobium sp. PNB]MCB4859167.1 hypothetical protein [Sphingobium sp. PNB]
MMLGNISLVGPRLAVGEGFLWRASLRVAYDKPGQGAVNIRVVDHAFGLRTVLAQDSVQDLRYQPSAGPSLGITQFRPPALLAVAAHVDPDADFSLRPNPDAKFKLKPVPVSERRTLFVSPAGVWPRQAYSAGDDAPAISTPSLRLVESGLEAVLKPGLAGRDPLNLRLEGNRVMVLGDLLIPNAPRRRELRVKLTPLGLEFEAAPPQFLRDLNAGLTEATRLTYRLTTKADSSGGAAGEPQLQYVLELVKAEAADIHRLHDSLAEVFRPTNEALSRVRIDYNSGDGPPPLSWPLTVVNGQLKLDQMRCVLRGDRVRIRLRSEPETLGGSQQVAEIAPYALQLSSVGVGAARCLTVEADTGTPIGEPTSDELRADVEFSWKPGDARLHGKMSSPAGAVPLGLDDEGLAKDLGRQYAQSGVLPKGQETSPYFFVPVQRGWLQMALPDPPPASAPRSASRPPSARGADMLWNGATAQTWSPATDADDLTRRLIEVDGALRVLLTLTWAWANRTIPPVTLVRFEQAWGRLRGHLYVAAASPSPKEILPSLLAGPAAVRDVVLPFGLGAKDEIRAKAQWHDAGGETVELELAIPQTDKRVNLAWLGHKTLPLIVQAPMTRTAAAGEPLHTRSLVPHQVNGAPKLILSPTAALPSLEATIAAWEDHWPWPALSEDGDSEEKPAVEMVMPTLPEARFAWPTFRNVDAPGLKVALGYDLPLLAEYFAGIRTPKAVAMAASPDPAGAPSPPTALEPFRLPAVWRQAAEGLALARTQSASLVPWSPTTGDAIPVEIAGLAEPFVWSTRFKFEPSFKIDASSNALPLGAYRLDGELLYGGSALAGGPDRDFDLDRTNLKLRKLAGAPLKVRGLAAGLRTEGVHAYDNRGHAIAQAPTSAPTAEVGLRQAAFDPGRIGAAAQPVRTFQRASLRAPMQVKLGTKVAEFWFRDLVLNAQNTFAMADSPAERASGPSATAFDRDRLPFGLHEWRLYEPMDADVEPAAGIAFGPFRFRPLRLHEVECEATTPATLGLQVASMAIAGVLELAPPREITADPEYESANLVLLTFTRSGAQELTLSAAERIEVNFTDSDAALVRAPNTPLQFSRCDARITAGATKGGTGLATLNLVLAPRATSVQEESLAFDRATLDVRLFGQDWSISNSKPAIAADDILKVSFSPPATPTAQAYPGGIEVTATATELTVNLKSFTAVLTRPAKSVDGLAIPALQVLSLAPDRLTWLGLKLPNPPIEIDHTCGCISLDLPGTVEAQGALIVGLPVGRSAIAGHVSLVFDPVAGDWPQANLRSGYADLTATYLEGPEQRPSFRHRLLISNRAWTESDLAVTLPARERLSRIQWPIDAVAALPVPPPAGRAVNITIGDAGPPLVHRVTVELQRHALGLDLLGSDRDAVRIYAPWRVLARARHQIADLSWTSVEALTVLDHVLLVRAATGDVDTASNSARTEYGFVPHYRNDIYRGDRTVDFMRNPGIARRALAAVGIPDLFLARTLAATPATGATEALLFAGGAATIVRTASTNDGDVGVQLTLPWLCAWPDDLTNVPLNSALNVLPQAPTTPKAFRATDVDLNAGVAVPIGLAPSAPAVLGASEFEILKTIRPLLVEPGRPAPIWPAERPYSDGSTTLAPQAPPYYLKPAVAWPAEQSYIEATAPITPQEMPYFLRSLLALRTIVSVWGGQTAKSHFASAIKVLIPARPDRDDRPPERSVALSISHRTASPEEKSAQLIVLERRLAQVVPPPSEIDLTALASGAAMRRLASAALEITRYPIAIVAVAEDGNAIVRRSVEAPPPIVLPTASLRLRPREQTLYAAATRGWPTRPEPMPLDVEPVVVTGEEAVLHAPELALGGRAAAFATPAYIRSSEQITQAAQHAVYLFTSRRAIFRRSRLSGGGTAPPARHLSPAAARLRAPTAAATSEALERVAAKNGTIRGMLPGTFERAALGGRAGAMFLETDGIVSSGEGLALDPQVQRFGVRGDLLAHVSRQLRAPRAGPLPETPDLAARRRTFVSAADIEAATTALKPCHIVLGPAGLIRLGDATTRIEFLVVDGADTDEMPQRLRRLPVPFESKLKIMARGPSATSGTDVLALLVEAGLFDPLTRVELRIGAARVAFASLKADVAGDYVIIEVALGDRSDHGIGRASELLTIASADAVPILRVTLGRSGLSPPPGNAIPLPLDPAVSPLALGPPRIVDIPLPLTASKGPSLPLETVLVAFGDPSYDRTLSSRAQSSRTADGRLLLAVDRPEYDRSVDILLAFGEIDKATNTFKPPTIAQDGTAQPVWPLELQVQRAQDPSLSGAALDKAAELKPVTVDGLSELKVVAGAVHSLPLRSLLSDDRGLEPGDQLIITAKDDRNDLVVRVQIVAELITPAPDAVYGLVTVSRDAAQVPVAASIPLYASAPMPQVIEAPNLLADLAAGFVRRRGLFIWRFATPTPMQGMPYAALVKVDRAGGGQIPEKEDDFSLL